MTRPRSLTLYLIRYKYKYKYAHTFPLIHLANVSCFYLFIYFSLWLWFICFEYGFVICLFRDDESTLVYASLSLSFCLFNYPYLSLYLALCLSTHTYTERERCITLISDKYRAMINDRCLYPSDELNGLCTNILHSYYVSSLQQFVYIFTHFF